MRSTRLRSRGFTLIATLLLLLLLSGIAIGLMMMVNTEGKVGGADLQNNVAYHSAEGGIEKMTSDLAAMFKTVQAPQPSDICALSALSRTSRASPGKIIKCSPHPAASQHWRTTTVRFRPARTRVCGPRSSRSPCWPPPPRLAARKSA